jgi:hypothetical protein
MQKGWSKMNGKNFAKTAGMFLAGLALGYAFAQYLSYRACEENECSCCEENPPLRVKPVPIAIKKK